MKSTNGHLLWTIFSFLLAALWSNNLMSVVIMFMGVTQITYFIEDIHLKRKISIIFSLLLIIAGILFFIGRWNHGNNFDSTFNHIF